MFLSTSGACQSWSLLDYCTERSPADPSMQSCPAWPSFCSQRTCASGLWKPNLHTGSPVYYRRWFLPRVKCVYLKEMLVPSSRRRLKARKAAIYPETHCTKPSKRPQWLVRWSDTSHVAPLLLLMGAHLVICQGFSLVAFFPPTEFRAQDTLCKMIALYFCHMLFFCFPTSPMGFNNLERVLCIEAWMRKMVNSRALMSKPFYIWDHWEKRQTRKEWFFMRLCTRIHNINYSEALLLHIEMSELKS